MTHFCFVVFSIIDPGPTIGGPIVGSIGALILIIISVIGVFYCCYRFHKNKNKQSKSNNLDMFIKYLKTMILFCFCRHTYIDKHIPCIDSSMLFLNCR